jgi:alpha 1,3-glucosidase
MLLLVCVCVFVGVALGVDRSKFQTCDSIGFCRRTRRASQQAEGRAVGAVRATAESLRVSAERVALELVFPQHENRVVLLELSGFSGSGVLRATMREKNALHPRFEALDALAPSLPEPAKLVYRPKPQTVSIKGGASVAIQFEPFALSVFNARGDHVMTINSRQFLNWEFYRSRPTEIQNDVDGEWDEKFGSHDDHKPRGPSAVSLDATFLGVDHVYGIPTHATNLSLPATRGEGKRYEQPFRLYNLDVFE